MELIILLLPLLFIASSSATFYFEFCPTPGCDQVETLTNDSLMLDYRYVVRKIHYDKLTLPEKMLNKDFLITMTALREVEAEDCDLTNIDLQLLVSGEDKKVHTLPKLTTLNLKNNLISKIQSGCFESAVALKHLDLSNNNISMLGQYAWSGLKELEELDVSSNQVEHLYPDFGFLPKLEKLDLSRNWLSYVDLNRFRDNPNLKHLNLNQNIIARLDPCSSELGLTNLDLSSNALANMTSLSNVPRIEHLSLSNNEMLVLNRNTIEQWIWTMKSLQLMAWRQWTAESYEILNNLVNLKSLSVGIEADLEEILKLEQLETLTIDGEELENKYDEADLMALFPKLKKVIYQNNHWEQPKQQPMDKKKMIGLMFEYKFISQTNDATPLEIKEFKCENYLLVIPAIVLLVAVVYYVVIILMKHLKKIPPAPEDTKEQPNVDTEIYEHMAIGRGGPGGPGGPGGSGGPAAESSPTA